MKLGFTDPSPDSSSLGAIVAKLSVTELPREGLACGFLQLQQAR